MTRRQPTTAAEITAVRGMSHSHSKTRKMQEILITALYAAFVPGLLLTALWLIHEIKNAPMLTYEGKLVPPPSNPSRLRCFLRNLSDPETIGVSEAWQMAKLDAGPHKWCGGCSENLPARFFTSGADLCFLCEMTSGDIRRALREAEGRLSQEEKDRMFSLYTEGDVSMRALGEDFGVSSSRVQRIISEHSGLAGITLSKHRNESIKAYGNAVVVPLVYQIFKSIQEYENAYDFDS